MGFLSGLAGIGKQLIGGMSGGGAASAGDGVAAVPQTGLQRHMGGLSQGLSSLSSNLFDQPAQAQPARRRLPVGPQPLGAPQASPEGSMSRVPYSTPDFAPGTGGGFVT